MTVMTVEIDVANDEHLVAEAEAAGCTAVEQDVFRMGGTYVYTVSGPREPLVQLLAEWGYPDEGDYRVL